MIHRRFGLNGKFYENYLSRYVGTFQRMKFKPEIRHIDEKMFKEYEKTPRKSVYILVLMAVIFFLYLSIYSIGSLCIECFAA